MDDDNDEFDEGDDDNDDDDDNIDVSDGEDNATYQPNKRHNKRAQGAGRGQVKRKRNTVKEDTSENDEEREG